MFERFTESARGVVMGGREAARDLQHDYIGTEHLLAALTCDGLQGPTIASSVLNGIDVTRQKVMDSIESIVGRGSNGSPGHIPFTPNAKKVLELSLREALRLGDPYIGPEHILLGVTHSRSDGPVATAVVILTEHCTVNVANLRQAVERQRGPATSFGAVVELPPTGRLFSTETQHWVEITPKTRAAIERFCERVEAGERPRRSQLQELAQWFRQAYPATSPPDA